MRYFKLYRLQFSSEFSNNLTDMLNTLHMYHRHRPAMQSHNYAISGCVCVSVCLPMHVYAFQLNIHIEVAMFCHGHGYILMAIPSQWEEFEFLRVKYRIKWKVKKLSVYAVNVCAVACPCFCSPKLSKLYFRLLFKLALPMTWCQVCNSKWN